MKTFLFALATFSVAVFCVPKPVSSHWEPGKWSGPNATGNRVQTTDDGGNGDKITDCNPNPTIWCQYIDCNGNLWLGDESTSGGPTGPGSGDPYFAQVTATPVP